MRRITPADDATITIFKKDPDAVLDFGFDWSEWLDSDISEVISTSTWTVPSGIDGDNESHDDSTTMIWISGGTAGATYLITNKITTSAERIDERSFKISVINR